MGVGISTIWRASGRGGVQIARGKEHISGILSAALGNCDSNNPFQDLGLGEDMIFDLADPSRLNSIADSVTEIVERLQGYELMSLQIRPDNLTIRRTDQGEYGMPVHIVDLETDDEYTMELTGSPQGVIVVQ